MAAVRLKTLKTNFRDNRNGRNIATKKEADAGEKVYGITESHRKAPKKKRKSESQRQTPNEVIRTPDAEKPERDFINPSNTVREPNRRQPE